MGSVGSLPRRFPLFSFFCLLVSLVSDFCPDTRGVVVDPFFLGSLVQSRCRGGGMLQVSNTGTCLQCLSSAGPAPAHRAHHSGSTLLCREPSETSPRLHAPPRSKPLRLGSQVALRGIRLGLRFAPFPGPSSSGVWRARSLRLLAFPIPAAQCSGCTAGALLRQMMTVQNPKKS